MSIELRPPVGAVTKKIIAGRGKAARKGGTAGRGNNGQNARSGGGVRPGFEGGQMPLYRRVARKGFSNAMFKKDYQVLNVQTLEDRFEDGDTISEKTLREKGLVSGKLPVKILGNGDLSKKLTVDVKKLSASAVSKIKKAGGSVSENKEG